LRIVEFEAGVVQKFDVINLNAIHVEQAGFINEYLQTIKLEHNIRLIADFFGSSR